MSWRQHCGAHPSGLAPGATILARVLCLGLLAAGMFQPVLAGDVSQAQLQPTPGALPAAANFERETASADVRRLADWVVKTTDNQAMPFVIVDKVDARVFVFDVAGKLRGVAPALLGLALGDDPNASIRNRKLADIGPELRVTPAGRFLASLGHDPAGKEILWIDYANSIALHAVATNRPEERRLQRLASPLPQDRRISWGCINVPKNFYTTVVSPAFKGTQGVVYVLPETRPASEVFKLN